MVLLLSALTSTTPAVAQFLPAKDRLTETPDAFARRIVKLYASNGRWWSEQTPAAEQAYRTKVFEAFYDPAFASLINDNGALAAKRLGGEDMEDDPVCQCQDDPGGIRVKFVRPRQGDFADVSAQVGCAEASGCTNYVMVLHRTAGLWAIYDVVDSAGSRRAWLSKHNACMRSSRSEAVIMRCMR
jgi:hypothetical protein